MTIKFLNSMKKPKISCIYKFLFKLFFLSWGGAGEIRFEYFEVLAKLIS